MSNTTVIVLCVAVPLLLSGFANYFAHKPWILYMPLIGLSLLIFYIGHLCIRSYVYPHTLDQPAAAPLDSATPTPMSTRPATPMKNDGPNQSINTVNQSGGQNIIAGGDVNLGPHRREITPEQETTILAALANAPKGKVVMQVSGSDQEAVNFQQRIEDILKKAGFEIITWQGLLPLDGKGQIGTILFIKDKMNIPAHARPIKDAMHKAGLEGRLGIDPTLDGDADALFIEVGSNPANQ